MSQNSLSGGEGRDFLGILAHVFGKSRQPTFADIQLRYFSGDPANYRSLMNSYFDRVSTTGARYAERLTLDRMRLGETRGNRSFYSVDYFDRLSLGNANQIVPAVGLAFNSYNIDKQPGRQPLAHSWLNASGDYAFIDTGATALLRERCASEGTLFRNYPSVDRNDTDVLIVFASSTRRLHKLRLRVRREVQALDTLLQDRGVYSRQTAYAGPAAWNAVSAADEAEYTLN